MVQAARRWDGGRLGWTVALLPAALAGCTSFGAVRSAEVQPGPSLKLQVSGTTPPGDGAAWFWALDCASDCDRSIVNMDLGLTLGRTPEREDGVAYALGLGWSGITYPYVDGYVQLRRGTNPYGLGLRAGIPVTGWNEYQVYGRYDLELEGGGRVLINPALFYHAGNSPNGQNPGRFFAFVNGVGLMHEGERFTFIPAASLVIGRGRRERYGEPIGPFTTVFGVVSMSVTLHEERN